MCDNCRDAGVVSDVCRPVWRDCVPGVLVGAVMWALSGFGLWWWLIR